MKRWKEEKKVQGKKTVGKRVNEKKREEMKINSFSSTGAKNK
jgi:hypothetical protein